MSQDSKKDTIIQSAIEVLLEQGVAHTSLNDIVRASGVSKGGVYHYFSSKEDVLVGVMEDFQAKHMDQLTVPNLSLNGDGANAMDNTGFQASDQGIGVHDKIVALIEGHQDLLEQMGKYNILFLDLFAQAARIPKLKEAFHISYTQFHQMISDLIEQGIASGEFQSDTDAPAVASAFIGLFDGIGAGSMVAPDRVDYPTHAVKSALIMLKGIKT